METRFKHSRRLHACAGALALAWLATGPAMAAVQETGDGGLPEATESEVVAPDNAISVPNPIVADRAQRLAAKGMTAGSPVMLRIFKAESELELWVQKEGRFELFATYPICFWSGKLGPKLHEGDRQAPEGLYSVGVRQLHRRGRWPRSLDIGFPNALDRVLGHTGSYILVHGGCTSTGCFAMTNPVIDEIYVLSEQALRAGQDRIQVHVFPFRMNEVNLSAYASSPWHDFWHNLKQAYDLFERTRVPPKVSVCDKKYVVSQGVLPVEDTSSPDAAMPTTASLCESGSQSAPVMSVETEDRAVSTGGRNRKVASKFRSRRFAGRNARRAYAAARRARVAAYARRMRTTHAH